MSAIAAPSVCGRTHGAASTDGAAVASTAALATARPYADGHAYPFIGYGA